MAIVAVPSHRIHSAFAAPSFASIAGAGVGGSVNALQASFNAQPNISLSSTRPRAAPLSILAARTAAASAPRAVPHAPHVGRPRRPSFRTVPIPSSTPTGSIDCARTSSLSAFPAPEPSPNLTEYVPSSLRAVRRCTAPVPTSKVLMLTYSSYSYPAVSTPRLQDTERTSRLVANLLLNRTGGRPMKRRIPSPGEERPYVPSCLSRMVEVEC